jgi:hypothetical protein
MQVEVIMLEVHILITPVGEQMMVGQVELRLVQVV